jgi:hypothetical protein
LDENISTAAAKLLIQLMIHGGFARLIMTQKVLCLLKSLGLGCLFFKNSLECRKFKQYSRDYTVSSCKVNNSLSSCLSQEKHARKIIKK